MAQSFEHSFNSPLLMFSHSVHVKTVLKFQNIMQRGYSKSRHTSKSVHSSDSHLQPFCLFFHNKMSILSHETHDKDIPATQVSIELLTQ